MKLDELLEIEKEAMNPAAKLLLGLGTAGLIGGSGVLTGKALSEGHPDIAAIKGQGRDIKRHFLNTGSGVKDLGRSIAKIYHGAAGTAGNILAGGRDVLKGMYTD